MPGIGIHVSLGVVDMSIPAIDPAVGGAGDVAVGGAGIFMPSMDCGGLPAGPGITPDGAPGAGLDGDMSMPGLVGSAAGVASGGSAAAWRMSMSGMPAGRAGAAALPARATGLGAGFLAAARAVIFGFALATGLAGIFMPGIGMLPMVWALAMAGSSAAAAAAARHRDLIISDSVDINEADGLHAIRGGGGNGASPGNRRKTTIRATGAGEARGTGGVTRDACQSPIDAQPMQTWSAGIGILCPEPGMA
ncbi:MAG TPA: hypothetical protein VF409_07755 [Sphingomonas sp.]